MKVFVHFLVTLLFFQSITFGSFLAKFTNTGVGQATPNLATYQSGIYKSYQSKNFFRNFCTEIKPEKLYRMTLFGGDKAEAEILARKLPDTEVLSRWHYQILYKNEDSGEEVSILAIPRVEIRKAAPGSFPRYFSDLECANAIVDAVRKIKSDPKLKELAFDWIVVKEVIYNNGTYGNQFIKLWKSAKPEPDMETIEELIKKSKFGKFWRSGPDDLRDNLPDNKGDF
jgi:hypothetical protein